MAEEQTSAHILIVEDDEALQEMMSSALRKEGYQVSQAFDGQAAVELVQKESPDLILLDMMLPKLDGCGVIKALKSSFETSLIPILVLSARGAQEDRLEALELGADDYVEKPFRINMLLNRVQGRLWRSTEEQEY